MFAIANTALDLLVLELVLHGLGVGIVALVLGILAPVDAGAEDDVLTNRRRVRSRAVAILCAGAKLRPRLSVSDAGIDLFGVCRVADSAGRLHFLTAVVVAVCDDGLGSILVRDGLRGRELGVGLLDIVVVGPVLAVVGSEYHFTRECARRRGCQLTWT